MPPTGRDYYEIAVRQFTQQILLAGMPATTVWGYGSVNHAGSFNYPAFTMEARHGCRVKVRWINDLVDKEGRFLPHLLPVDQTLHWANPPGGRPGVTRTAATRRRTPDRCRSSPTSTATTRSTTATLRGGVVPAGRLRHPTRIRDDRFVLRVLQGEFAVRRAMGRRKRGLRLSERPASRDAVVPRPHARDDAAERVRGARRLLPPAWRPRRPSPR